MERRTFLKASCTMCVGAMAGLSALALLESCATGKIVTQNTDSNILILAITAFSAVNPYVIIRTKKLSYDVLVYKKTDNTYTALYMQCTHYDNPVYANGKEIFCPSHGSKFNFDGVSTKEPASIPLKKFPLEIKDNNIYITITTE